METHHVGAPSPREFHLFDAIVGMITQPVLTLRHIALVRHIGLAVLHGLTNLTFLRSDFDSGIVGSPAMDSSARDFLDTITTPSFLFGSALVITPLILLIETGILHLVGRLLGGHGPFNGLLFDLRLRIRPPSDHGAVDRRTEPWRFRDGDRPDPGISGYRGRNLGPGAASAGDPGEPDPLNRPGDRCVSHPVRAGTPPGLRRWTAHRVAGNEHAQPVGRCDNRVIPG